MIAAIKTIFRIFTLNALPQELPYSTKVLGIILILSIITQGLVSSSVVSLAAQNSNVQSSLSAFSTINFLFMELVRCVFICTWMYACLWYCKKTDRFVQSTMALTGVNILLAGCFLLIMLLWQFSTVMFVLFFVLLYWNFILMIHIFGNCYDVGVIRAGLLSILFMFLQHQLSSLVIKVLT